MNIFSMLLAILAGVFTTIESSINSQLGKSVTPGIATFHSLLTGVTFILLVNLISGNLVKYQKVAAVKPVLLIGGFFGASIIYLMTRAIPALGISNTVILVLVGQLTSGLIVDSIINDLEMSIRKMAGMLLFIVGAVMFLKE